jgi:hypothetical protein
MTGTLRCHSQEWVKMVNRDGERCRYVTRAAFLDISDGGFRHEFLFLSPECLWNEVFLVSNQERARREARIVTTRHASQTSTTTEHMALQRRHPVQTTSNRRRPKIPSECPQPVNHKTQPRDRKVSSRALIPVRRDPLQVEVITGHRTSATNKPLFCSGLICHSAYLRRVPTRKGGHLSNARASKDTLKSTNITHPRRP